LANALRRGMLLEQLVLDELDRGNALEAEIDSLETILVDQHEMIAALEEVLLEHSESLDSNMDERDRQVALCIGAATAFASACFDDLDLSHAPWPAVEVDADVHALYGWLGDRLHELTTGLHRRAVAQSAAFSVKDKFSFVVDAACAFANIALDAAHVARAMPPPPTARSSLAEIRSWSSSCLNDMHVGFSASRVEHEATLASVLSTAVAFKDAIFLRENIVFATWPALTPQTPVADITDWFTCATALYLEDARSRMFRRFSIEGFVSWQTKALSRMRKQNRDLKTASEKALAAAQKLVFKAFDVEESAGDNIILFTRPQGLDLANAEQWLALRSHDLTLHQEERIGVHRQWLDGTVHMLTLVFDDLKVPVQWPTHVTRADTWFKDRINEYFAGINTERKQYGVAEECAYSRLVQIKQLRRRVFELEQLVGQSEQLIDLYRERLQ
jgi:hypothetical protein